MLGAILSVWRTGRQWNALPRALGAATTVYDRLRAGEADGCFARRWAAGLPACDELVGIDGEWLSMDGVLTTAPCGGAAPGAHPTARGQRGTKRSTRSDGQGRPMAIVGAGATMPDRQLAAPTLDALGVDRPEPTPERPPHLCLDAGSDDDLPRFAAEQRGSVVPIRPRGEERAHAGASDPLQRPRRWGVERRHSWLNRSRRLLVRWEKLDRTYEAFRHLACALLCFQPCDRLRAA
jgi:putative transposase